MNVDPEEIVQRGEFSSFSVALRHDSIIIVEVPHRLTPEGLKGLHTLIAKKFPGQQLMILDAGMRLHVVHPAEPPEAG